MSRTQELRADLDVLMRLADEIRSLGIHCHAVDDMLTRLSASISSTCREILMQDAAALLRAAETFGGLL